LVLVAFLINLSYICLLKISDISLYDY